MNELIGYCGLDCGQCDARIATVNNDDELRARTAKLWCGWIDRGLETCADCPDKAICAKLAPFMDNEVARKNMNL